MVTITDFKARVNSNGEKFYALILQGDVDFVQSATTGNFYATARTASITSTFNETVCQSLIGKQMAGTIIKTECEPYEYANPETGELLTLTHRYTYMPENTIPKQAVQESAVPVPFMIGANAQSQQYMA